MKITSFKPYYKWITFNTSGFKHQVIKGAGGVLNLIINGLPSILLKMNTLNTKEFKVLNLIINGLPSIL